MKRRVSALLLALTLAVSLASGAFAATYSNWFKSNYQEMQNLKILPDQFTGMDLKQPITRGEMCLLAVQAFEEATGNDLELDGTQYFTDTNDTNITKAYEYGIVSGYPDGTFRPEKTVSRAEFLTLFARIAFPDEWKQAEGDEWWKAAYDVCTAHRLLDDTAGSRSEAMPRGASRPVLLRLGRRA